MQLLTFPPPFSDDEEDEQVDVDDDYFYDYSREYCIS